MTRLLNALDLGRHADRNGRQDYHKTERVYYLSEKQELKFVNGNREIRSSRSMKELVDDIRENGILVPLLVARLIDGTLVLVDGQHRYIIAKTHCRGIAVPYVIRWDGITEEEAQKKARGINNFSVGKWKTDDFKNSLIIGKNENYIKFNDFQRQFGLSTGIAHVLVTGMPINGRRYSTDFRSGCANVAPDEQAFLAAQLFCQLRTKQLKIEVMALAWACRAFVLCEFDCLRLQRGLRYYRPSQRKSTMRSHEDAAGFFEDIYNKSEQGNAEAVRSKMMRCE
jgi:hypothetical protein